MRIRWYGKVVSVRRQPDKFPTLVYVVLDGLAPLHLQAAHDCDDVTGREVVMTLDVDEAP